MLNTDKNLNSKNIPQHVAIIMDGNGRWATKRLLPRINGHNNALNAVRAAIETSVEYKIKALTLFGFGIDNWKRPEFEVNSIMSLISKTLKSEFATIKKENIKFLVIGDKSRLNKKLQTEITKLEKETKNNIGLRLNIALSYSGTWDITEACKSIAKSYKDGKITLQNINEDLVNKTLCLGDLPAPDLLIRTSGEKRISNFLLWQLAYAELYFTDILWPDFNKEEYIKAIEFFASRQRRFGQTPEQLNKFEVAQNSIEELEGISY